MGNRETGIVCTYCSEPMMLLYEEVSDKVFWNKGKWKLYKCGHCKLLSISPAPLKDELGKFYNTYYTHSQEKSLLRQKIESVSKYIFKLNYFERLTFWQAVINALLPNFLKRLFLYEIYLLRQKDGVEIFDVGFGNGSFITKMIELGVYPSGCDFDKKCVELINNQYGLRVYHGALSEIADKKKYDIVTYGHVVEHLYDLKEELMNVRKKLKEGGKVVGLTPNIESLGHMLFKDSWRGLEPPRHLHIYSMAAIRRIAEECGFRVVKLKTTARYARHIMAASLMIRLNRRATASGGGRGVWIAMFGYLLQLVEWSINLFKKNAGEEIFFVLQVNKS